MADDNEKWTLRQGKQEPLIMTKGIVIWEDNHNGKKIQSLWSEGKDYSSCTPEELDEIKQELLLWAEVLQRRAEDKRRSKAVKF